MLSILITYFSGLAIIVLKSIKYTQEGVSPFLFEKIFITLHIINIIILYKHKKIYKIKNMLSIQITYFFRILRLETLKNNKFKNSNIIYRVIGGSPFTLFYFIILKLHII